MVTNTEQPAISPSPGIKRRGRKLCLELSETEEQLLYYIAEGYTNREIALLRYVSLDTVESHRRNVIRKLKVNNSAQAVAVALRHKLIA